MADAPGPVEDAKVDTPLENTGRGYFHPESTASSSLTYILTPKYADPYAKGDAKKLARFFIPSSLAKQIRTFLGKGSSSSGDTQEATDTVLSKLSDQNSGYFDFFLQAVDEIFDDKFQIVETMGDSYAAFGLGHKPRVFQFSGYLMNTVENDWRVNFIYMYRQFLGISRLSKFKGSTIANFATIKYDSVFARGALLNLRTSLRAENELVTPFSFTMLVTGYTWVDLSNLDKFNIGAVLDGNAPRPQSQGVTALSSEDELNQKLALSKTEFNELTST